MPPKSADEFAKSVDLGQTAPARDNQIGVCNGCPDLSVPKTKGHHTLIVLKMFEVYQGFWFKQTGFLTFSTYSAKKADDKFTSAKSQTNFQFKLYFVEN